MRIDGYHLPGLDAPATTVWSYGAGGRGGVELRVPRLTPESLSRQVDSLLAARREHLVARPVGEVVGVIDRVAARLLDDGDPLRAEALTGIEAATGHSAPMARAILDGMAADWRAGPLERLVASEFGDPPAIDDFVERPGTGVRSRAFGPRLAVHVFSGNVPGVSVTSLIRSLLVKAATLGKTAAGEPVLAPLFARALAEADPDLGACLAVTYWAGGDEALEAVALGRAEAVVGYGGAAAVESLRARTPPDAVFLGYGHRVSFGVVSREALDDAAALARDAALAVATFDQQGCVSPHLFYVEENGRVDPRAWAAQLADALRRLEADLPRGAVSPGEAAAIRQARAEAEFAQLAGRGVELFTSSEGTAWTVIFDPDPAFSPSCLNRLVRVKPVESIESVPDRVRPLGSVLQTVGIEAPESRLRELAGRLGALGASRVTRLAAMPWPPPTWRHDGRPPLGDLVRWCDLG